MCGGHELFVQVSYGGIGVGIGVMCHIDEGVIGYDSCTDLL